jgi:hypothetical protein
VANKTQENSTNNKRSFREYLPIFLVFATAFAAGIGDIFFYAQWDAMKTAILLDQRPWVSLEVNLGGPLTADASGWHIPLTYQLKNLGRTPGIDVSFFAHAIPTILAHQTSKGAWVAGTNLHKELDDVCGFPEMASRLDVNWGQLIFPEEKWPIDTFGVIGTPEIFKEAAAPQSGYSGQLLIVTCVSYGSTLNAWRYRTARAFYLAKKTGSKSIDLSGETIYVPDLAFSPARFHGSYTQ